VIAADKLSENTYTIKIEKSGLKAPQNLTYNPSAIIAERGISNILASPQYLGDSAKTFSISPALPAGISFNTSSGVISGIPSILSPLVQYTIFASNDSGSTQGFFSLAVYIPNKVLSATRFETEWNVNPNPFNGTFQIKLNSKTNSKVKLTLFDALGREVYLKELEVGKGINEMDINNLQNLENAVYFIQLSSDENHFLGRKKVVKN
jgi:hypothetical protein